MTSKPCRYCLKRTDLLTSSKRVLVLVEIVDCCSILNGGHWHLYMSKRRRRRELRLALHNFPAPRYPVRLRQVGTGGPRRAVIVPNSITHSSSHIAASGLVDPGRHVAGRFGAQ